ncbi:epsin-3 [Vigna angularis]|uniref:epsin-3 n=1 Tax=Phaseolus angularis TaxID=3914 RepID=UPI0022B5322D|nr:epsin-3 [Vigna angularis]
MGSLFLEQIKKQTTNFLQEKYKSARMTFTDVTETELLAEEATNKDDCSPDAKTMTRIAEASFDIDEYWRIVDILHHRYASSLTPFFVYLLYNVDWEQWRQAYKTMVLLEFLLTHGPQEFAPEFQCDVEIIEDLGGFTHIDEKGTWGLIDFHFLSIPMAINRFNWGSRMQKLSDEIVKLLQNAEALTEARLKALKITNGIQGFGSSVKCPSPTSSSSAGSSSFYSFFTTSTPDNMFHSNDELNKQKSGSIGNNSNINIMLPPRNLKHVTQNHLWKGFAGEEKNILIDSTEDEYVQKPKGFVGEIFEKISAVSPVKGEKRGKVEFRCLSDVGKKVTQQKFDRQYSFWF